MRISVVATIILAGLLVLVGMLGLKRLSQERDQAQGSPTAANQASPGDPSAPVTEGVKGSAGAATPTTLAAGGDPGRGGVQAVEVGDSNSKASNAVPRLAGALKGAVAGEQAAYVRLRVGELEELATETDQQSLEVILSELTNTNKTIRAAAREAAVHFGSRDAIPKLQDAAAAIEDPREKVALLDAIEFLELPSLTEVLAQRKEGKSGPGGERPVNLRHPRNRPPPAAGTNPGP